MRLSDLTEQEQQDNQDEVVFIKCDDCAGSGVLTAECSKGIESCCFACTNECDACESTGEVSKQLWEIGDEQEFKFEN